MMHYFNPDELENCAVTMEKMFKNEMKKKRKDFIDFSREQPENLEKTNYYIS